MTIQASSPEDNNPADSATSREGPDAEAESARSIRPQPRSLDARIEREDLDSIEARDVTPGGEPVYGNMTIPAEVDSPDQTTGFNREALLRAKLAASQLNRVIRANWLPSAVLAASAGFVVVRLLRRRQGDLARDRGGDLVRDRVDELGPQARDRMIFWCDQVQERVQSIGESAQDQLGEIRQHILTTANRA